MSEAYETKQWDVFCENNELRLENAELTRMCERLMRENAELRELVRIMYYCSLPWSDCDKCAMNGADMRVALDELAVCDCMNDRMRELGVEVDE